MLQLPLGSICSGLVRGPIADTAGAVDIAGMEHTAVVAAGRIELRQQWPGQPWLRRRRTSLWLF